MSCKAYFPMAVAGLIATAIGFTATAANAATDVSINTASYSYASYDPNGNPISVTYTQYGADGVQDANWASDNLGYWTATTTFSATSSDVLTITDLSADDRVAIEINGNDTGVGAGIFGPGLGAMEFTPGAASVPYTFYDNGQISATSPVTVSGDFINGTNTITLIVNNTFNGIQDCGNPPTCGFNPSNLSFSGSVGPVAVPELSTWAMMLVGFVLVGGALRARSSKVRLTFA